MARLRPGWRIAVVITFALASCGAPAAVSSPPTSCALDCAPGAGTPHAQVFVEPDAGAAPVLAAIAGATASRDLEIYLLSDTSVIQALEEAANRGVDVRVLLEYAPFGDAGTAAQITAEKLMAAGVHVKRSNPAFRYTHEKAMVVDQATAYIMSCNLTRSGLGGSSSAADRDYGVIDTDPQDVCEIATIFDADWDRTTPTLSAPTWWSAQATPGPSCFT